MRGSCRSGAPVYLATTQPLVERAARSASRWRRTRAARFAAPVRADFFWGFGTQAGREAGRMRQDGRMWLLWPKGAPLPDVEHAQGLETRLQRCHQASIVFACWSA